MFYSSDWDLEKTLKANGQAWLAACRSQ